MRVSLWLRSGLSVLTLVALNAAALAAPPTAPQTVATNASELVLSYKKPTANGQYLFVMVGSDPERSGSLWSDERKTLARDIRRTYPRSGLYRNDGSTVPLWGVDWHAPPGSVEVLPDGAHLVRTSAWGTNGEGGIDFYANGRLVKGYHARDLVDDNTQLDHIESQVTGWIRETSYDEKEQQYTLTTLDGNTFVFDARTGDIISASRPGRLWRGIFILTLGVVVGMVTVSATAQLVRHLRNRVGGGI